MLKLIPLVSYNTSTDINECDEGLDDCSVNSMCINTISSFECECLPEFTGDGVTCEGQRLYILHYSKTGAS